jgi:hypothetical protein
MPSITENGITIIIVCLLGVIIFIVGCIIRNSNDLTPRPTVAFQAIFLEPIDLEQNANMYIREAETHSQNDDLQVIVVNVQILGDDAFDLSIDAVEILPQSLRFPQSLHLPIAQPIDTTP